MCGAQALEFHRPLLPGRGAAAARDAVRESVPFIQEDSVLSGHIASLEKRSGDGDIVRAVEAAAGPLLARRRLGMGGHMEFTPGAIRAPRGSELSCRGWAQEAALRMLCNNLDNEVAEDPKNLVVYGGRGKAARNWDASTPSCGTLRDLRDDQTLLVQSGKPVAVFPDATPAPRACSSPTRCSSRSGPPGSTSGSSRARDS